MDRNQNDFENLILQGNEACAKGAVHSGCSFFAGYPITPSTEIIEYFASEMKNIGGSFIQMEDEIGSACAIIGARWGGSKSMTATSGPGFTLMQEAIGYAVATETPIVIVDVQRGGPSTGQPTLPSQQDIYQARYGSHGDYEIIALAPSSVQEMFDFTVRAFELAEKYRTPVIILTDEIIGHMREKIKIGKELKLYRDEKNPYVSSPQEDFYTGANTLAEGQLHDPEGRRIGHLPKASGEFVKRINRKILDNIEDITDMNSYFMDDADIAFVTYGTVARPAVSAVQLARGVKDKRFRSRLSAFVSMIAKGDLTVKNNNYQNLKVGLIKINTVWPFPEKKLAELTENVNIIVVPEMNIGKYYREIQRALPGKKVVSLPKMGGDLHLPEEMLDEILKEVGLNE